MKPSLGLTVCAAVEEEPRSVAAFFLIVNDLSLVFLDEAGELLCRFEAMTSRFGAVTGRESGVPSGGGSVSSFCFNKAGGFSDVGLPEAEGWLLLLLLLRRRVEGASATSNMDRYTGLGGSALPADGDEGSAVGGCGCCEGGCGHEVGEASCEVRRGGG
jgi:hypothetical protein